MKGCYSVLRRQILEDVLGEKVEEYENFHKTKLSLNKRQHRKLIPLWKFLLHLLNRDKKSSYIEWNTERALEFRILDTNSVAELWGSMKNKSDMTYEKLGRAMRYYYGKSIIEKVNGKRYSYRFILSRRTKKYISQFVDVKGMKLEPIDSRCKGSNNLNVESGSFRSSINKSDEECSLSYDTASPTPSDYPPSSLDLPPSPKKVVSIFIKNEEVDVDNKTAKSTSEQFRTIQNNMLTNIRGDILGESTDPLHIINEQLPNWKSSIEGNTMLIVPKLKNQDNMTDEKHSLHEELCIKQEEMSIDESYTLCENQVSMDCNNIQLNEPDYFRNNSRTSVSDINDDSDLSSLTGSISSEEFDPAEFIDVNFLGSHFDTNEVKSEKTDCKIIQTDLGLNRQIDPFMGCDFVRLTECERMSGFDVSFNEIFDEYLFYQH